MRKERKAGRARPENATFPLFLSFVFFLCLRSFWRIWGEEWEASLGRHGSPWVSTGGTGRG